MLRPQVLDLAKHGVAIKPDLAGLLPDQIKELKLVDEFEEQCVPSGGFAYEADPVQRRNGRAPTKAMKEVLAKAVAEVKARVSKDNIGAGVEVTEQTIKQSLDLIKGATTIVWPMGLPPTDPVRLELENCEELQGTQESKMVLDPAKTTLWFASKELTKDKQLKDFLGKNEKTKVNALYPRYNYKVATQNLQVVVKLNTTGSGPPVREPLFNEEERKAMMLAEHRRREEVSPIFFLQKASLEIHTLVNPLYFRLKSFWRMKTKSTSTLPGLTLNGWPQDFKACLVYLGNQNNLEIKQIKLPLTFLQ